MTDERARQLLRASAGRWGPEPTDRPATVERRCAICDHRANHGLVFAKGELLLCDACYDELRHAYPRIEDTSETLPRVDPGEVAEGLGAVPVLGQAWVTRATRSSAPDVSVIGPVAPPPICRCGARLVCPDIGCDENKA